MQSRSVHKRRRVEEEVVIRDSEPETDSGVDQRPVEREGDFFRQMRKLCEEKEARVEEDHREMVAQLSTKVGEVAAKNAEVDALNGQLAVEVAKSVRLVDGMLTCRWYGCDKNSVLGLRCPVGHGLCDEHTEEMCSAVKEHTLVPKCVEPGCCKRFCKTAFQRCGVVEAVALKCVERVVRDEIEVETNALRQAEEERRQQDPTTEITAQDIQFQIDLKRPCCGNLMPDFTECMAIHCDYEGCGKYFCGVCLDEVFAATDSGSCHTHVRLCNQKHFGHKNSYLTKSVHETQEQTDQRFRRHYEGIQNERMRKFFLTKNVVMGRIPKNIFS